MTAPIELTRNGVMWTLTWGVKYPCWVKHPGFGHIKDAYEVHSDAF
jgi:hypothetical protein